MKVAIIDKINQELSIGIKTEKAVLYVLAEIRKYLDQCVEEERDKYPSLCFYCNWVLHVEMDRTPAKNILKKFETDISGAKTLNEISNIFKTKEKDFYSFIEMREELKNFLETNNLPTDLVNSGAKWFRFKKLLVEILIDCPLVKESGRVSKFFYEKGEDKQIRFRVKIRKLGSFKITLKEKWIN